MRKGEATPRKHAHAVLDALPGLTAYAGKQLNWRFDKQTQTRVPMSRSEDFFGCFDALYAAPGDMRFVQWTSIKGVAARRDKVKALWCDPLYTLAFDDAQRDGSPWLDCAAMGDVEVWGWVARTGFRVWRYDWAVAGWEEQELLASPLLKARG